MSHKKIAFFIITGLIIFFTSSCGLDTIITLKPPEFVGFSNVDKNFIFRATGDYDSYYFRGFELYYKIYLNDATTDSNLLNLSELNTNGFKRIASDSDRINNISKPLIPVDLANHGDVFDIKANFAGIKPSSSEPVAEDTDGAAAPPTTPFSVKLRRGIAENRLGFDVDQYKPFSVFEEGDADISSEIWNAISGNNVVTLVIYALSYGKRDLIIDVYSIAVYLFEIDLKLPQ